MNTRSIGAATLALSLAAAPLGAMAKGGHGGGRIGKGPGSMRESADTAASGKTETLPSDAKQAERHDEKGSAKQ